MSKLRIQILIKPISFFPWEKDIYNTKPYKYGLKITNIDVQSFGGGEIYGIEYWPISADKLRDRPAKKVAIIKPLKPNEIQEIWFEEIKVNIPGEYWLSCDIRSNDGSQVKTYQYIEKQKLDVEEQSNSWGDKYFVGDYLLRTQLETNQFLLWITIYMFIATSLSAYYGFRLWKISENDAASKRISIYNNHGKVTVP